MPATSAETNPGTDAGDEGISLPLYAGGLVVTLCGVLTVVTAISPNSGTAVESVAVVLTLLGYAFSLACRHLKVQSRLIEIGCVAFVLYIVARLAMHDRNLDWFLSGADRQDTRLAAALMWLAVLRSWTLTSDDLVMFSCVLSAAMIGLVGTQDVNTVTVLYFCVFVMALVFLLIHQNYLQNRRLAAPHERSQPVASLLPAQIGLTALCGLVVLALGAILITPAQALFANVSLAQAIRGLIGADHARDADAVPGVTRFSDDATMEIGQGSVWPTTSEVMLHVMPSDGAPHYWRGRTYDLYLGTDWQSTQDSLLTATVSGELPEGTMYTIPTASLIGEGGATSRSIRRQPLVSSVEVRGDTDQFYYPDEPRSLLIDADAGGKPRPSMDGRIDLDGHPVRSVYTVRSSPPPDLSSPEVQAHLRRDGTDYPADIRQLYLRSPLDSQDFVTTPADVQVYRRIRDEALAGLPPGRRTPFDKAVAIRDWIAGHCTYSLDVKPIPADTDHVRYFLQDERRGYCDLFASSMVMLCRTAGIPARVATGFAPGDRDETGFNLRAMDKHAWAEVYFPGDRWQIFDATIGTSTDGSVPVARAGGESFLMRAWSTLSKGGLVTELMAVAILLALSYLGKTEIYDRLRAVPRARPTRPDPVEQGYGLLTRTLARLGLPRRPWETPAEFERRATAFLAAQEAVMGVAFPTGIVSDVTARFTAARYSAVPPENDPALGVIYGISPHPPLALVESNRGVASGTSGGPSAPFMGLIPRSAGPDTMELEYTKIAAKGFPQPIARVYLFQGGDDALKREAVLKLTAPLLDDAMADFDREERDAPSSGGGDADFARQMLSSAAGMPMLSERRVVIVTNVHRLSKEDQDTLAAGLGNLGERSLLVLIAGAPEYDAGKVKGRSAVGAKLAGAVAKGGCVVLCDAPAEGDLSARAKALVKSRGKQIEPEALRRLMDRAKSVAAERGGGGKGGDLNVLTNELEKALAYAGTRPTVTLADAAAVSPQGAEENIFALLDAVGSRDVRRALGEVDEMLRVGDKPDGVAARTFVMLARHLRQLWAAKYLAEKRLSGDRLPPEVQALLSGEMLGITQRQSYRMRGLQQQARGWDAEKLHRALARTLASDMAMKGIAPIKALGVSAPGDDPASNLRLLVVDLCG